MFEPYFHVAICCGAFCKSKKPLTTLKKNDVIIAFLV